MIPPLFSIFYISSFYIYKNTGTMNIPKHYIPNILNARDRIKQRRNIKYTRKQYKHKNYINRPKLKSFKSKPSPHITRAKRKYKVDKIVPSKALAKATKCSIKGLRQITRKGRGAYFSSGSRPNQSAQSWARARLASAITHGKAAKIDRHILEKECQPDSPALG